MKNWLYSILGDKRVILLLLVVNILGTVYGYYWYLGQLAITPAKFLAFVPDSPTASLFFVIALFGLFFKRNYGLFEALAIVSLVKYGVWAVVMNVVVFIVNDSFSWIALMLVLSHAAMALEGILYAPFFRIKAWHMVVTGIIVLHNEIIDYVFGMMPIYSDLNQYIPQIGYFTFWLSIASIGIGYWFTLRKDRRVYSIQSNK